MSEFEEQVDDAEAICPYCMATHQPEAEDYSEDSREIECYECGKKYWLNQSFSVSHWAKPDCALNGTEHVWETKPKYPEHKWCVVCGKCESIRASSETAGVQCKQ